MATTNDVPMPRFIAPVIPDDEFAEDTDVSFMRAEAIMHENRGCVVCRWLCIGDAA